jgi:site-specific DNA recombinase
MPNTNGHGPKRVILYARVSTDEQARSGYSLAQQLEALREYAAREGYEILEEVTDPGQSGASLERPGMDRVRDLVAAGGVSAVLAQDRDRFAREPAYHYLLKREFEEYSCKLQALNDRGDDSPEGQLTDDILDTLAKFERAKTAERTRRGLLRKAKEGKVIKGPKPNFGFRFNEANDQLVIYEPEMQIVHKIFRMAAEGMGAKAIQTRLYHEKIWSPTGKAMWPHRIIKTQLLLNDLYRPHIYQEISALVSPEVATRLDPSKSYGIWWFNRRNVKKRKTTKVDGKGGRRYKVHTLVKTRDRNDWIAVPVPACLPRELVDQARFLISSRKGHERKHRARDWELKGLMRCGCGQNMMTSIAHGGKYSYYKCKRSHHYGPDACPQKGIRIEKVEPLVWDFVSRLLKNPERIRRGMEALIRREREGTHEYPTEKAEVWEAKLAENARLRRAYQDQQATGLMTLEELASRLEELEDARKAAEAEIAALQRSQKRTEELKEDREAVLASLTDLVPQALDSLTGEERNRLYRMLRMEITPTPEGFNATGVFCSTKPTAAGEKAPRERWRYGSQKLSAHQLYS